MAGYRRVLAIDPEHQGAQREVATLASDWKGSIDEALQQGNLENAQTRLEEASAVFPSDVQWIQLNVELQNRFRAQRIMISAEALLTSNGMSDLPSATAAIQSFQEVLRLAPENQAAQQALNDIAVHYAGLASDAAGAGEVSTAINLLERASAADATLTELDDVRRLISQATTARAAIDDLLQQARRYRAENQLIEPPGANAAELYHRVLATDPGNVIATQGLDEVTSQITARVDQLLAGGQLDAVGLMMTQAASAGMSEVVINDIRGRLDAEQERFTNGGEQPCHRSSINGPGLPPPRLRRITRSLSCVRYRNLTPAIPTRKACWSSVHNASPPWPRRPTNLACLMRLSSIWIWP